MKKSLLFLSLLVISLSAFSQTLYLPNGTPTGIGATTNPGNGRVGIGTASPVEPVELVTGTRKVGFNGAIQLTNPGGLISLSDVSGNKNFFIGVTDSTSDAVLANLSANSEMRFVSSGYGPSQGFGFYMSQINYNAFHKKRPIAAVKIDGSGKLGLGTATPSVKLDVVGGGGSYVDMKLNGRIQLGDANNQSGIWMNPAKTVMVGQFDGTRVGINNNGWRIVANDNGKIGINVTNPAYALHVGGAGTTNVDMAVNGRLQSGDATNNGGIFVNSAQSMLFGQLNANAFGMNYGGTWALIAGTSGKIGINNTNPVARLDVLGTGGTTSDVKVNGRIQSGDTGNLGGLVVGTGTSLMFGQQSATSLGLYNNGSWRLIVDNTGKVGIGTTAPDAPLAVKGKIHAQEVKVDLTGAMAPDYVFDKDYALPSLEKVKEYIDKNHHLPEVPSAKEIEANGVELGEMNLLLLKKIEELTLYVIDLKKEVNELKANK